MGSNQSKSALAAVASVASVANKKTQSQHANVNNKNHTSQKQTSNITQTDNKQPNQQVTKSVSSQQSSAQASNASSSFQANATKPSTHQPNTEQKDSLVGTSTLKSFTEATKIIQQMTNSGQNNNPMLELNNNMVHLLREGITNIQSHSEKFLSDMKQRRLEKQNCLNEIHHATIDGFHKISQTYLEAAQSSLSSMREKNPVSFIETNVQTASKLGQAYSSVFTAIRDNSIKMIRHNMDSFYKNKK